MEYQDKEDFLRNALRDSVGNLFVKANADDLKHLPVVRGPDFDKRQDVKSLLDAYRGIGIQASVFSQAIECMNGMYNWKLEEQDKKAYPHDEDDLKDYFKKRCLIFLGCSANLMSSGTREVVRHLLKYRMVDVLVTPAGGVEEDLIRCFGEYRVAPYEAPVPSTHEKQGNVWVPKDLQQQFKAWFKTQIGLMHDKQDVKANVVFTPSLIIRELGLAINDERSCLYWAAKNNVPVFSPAFTDGFVGECLFEYNRERPGFIICTARDIYEMDKMPHRAKCTGVIILGGGIVKHHILNANMLKNGASFGVFVNTGSEWEASDSGAKPTEALSWGKLKIDSEFAKVYGDANVVAPLLIAGSVLRDTEKYRRDLEWHAELAAKANKKKK